MTISFYSFVNKSYYSVSTSRSNERLASVDALIIVVAGLPVGLKYILRKFMLFIKYHFTTK